MDLQAEGGQQLAQLAVGVVQAVAQFGGDGGQGFHGFAPADQGLHAADLQLHVRQRLRQGVVQFPGDDGALVEQQQTMVLFALAFERQRSADQVGQGLDQLLFPVLRRVAIVEVGLEFAQFRALVADAEYLRRRHFVFMATRAIADGADVTAVAAVQGEHLLGRCEEVALQAQRQAQPRQAFLEAPDQFVQALGIGQARGQAAAALVQQLEGGVGLLQVEGLEAHLAFQGAVGRLDGLGHGVEAQGQLPQLIVGAVVDPGLEVAVAKAPGGLYQFLQRVDHAVLQFIQADQQDDQRAEQRQALDALLPALFAFALLLQQADELIHLLDECRRAGLELRRITARQGRAQLVVPALLDLLVALQQGAVRAVFQHRFERVAVESPLQALGDGVDLFGRRGGGEPPAEVVGLHTHGAGGVDCGGVALTEPGDQPRTQGTGKGQDSDQDHSQAGACGQGAA